MKLEVAEYPVKQIRLSHRFQYADGMLDVDESELLALVREDARIEDVSLAVALPGERTRITGIRDIVEPRCKISGGGQVFAGVLGAVAVVGAGRTHRLSGMAVVVSAGYEGTIRAGTTVQRSAILDMSGPGAAASRFSSLCHLVISFKIAEGLAELDAHTAIQLAEFKVAERVARATADLPPVNLATFELDDGNSHLPKVMLIQGVITDPQHVLLGGGTDMGRHDHVGRPKQRAVVRRWIRIPDIGGVAPDLS